MITSPLCKLFLIGSVSFIAVCAVSPVRVRTGEIIDDLAIATKIKTALLKDPSTHVMAVDVACFKGIVQLCGLVATQNEKHRAAQIAASINGVRGVQNELVVA